MATLFKKRGNLSKQVKASTAYTICSILQRSLSFITLPLFSRLLTTDEYGLSTVYSSTMALLIIFTSLQLPYGSFSTAMSKFADDRDSYITSVNVVCTALTALFLLIYLPFNSFFNKYLDLTTSLMVLMSFEMLMSTSLNFWMGKQRFEYKYKSVVVVTLSLSIIGTATAIIATLTFSNKGFAKIVAYSAVAILIGMVPYIFSMAKIASGLKIKYIKYALSFNIPLIPYYLSQMIFNQSDRLMINSICGRSDAAIYGVAYTLAVMLTFVLNAINNSYVPWFYEKLKKNDFEDNKKITIAITVLMSFLLLGIIAFTPEIIYILAGEKYANAIWVVPPVAMSIVLLLFTQFSINVEFFYEEKKAMVLGSILSAIVNIVLNYFFLKIFGFIAAAYTTLLSYVLFAVCNYINMVKICKKKNIDKQMYDIPKLLIIFLIFCLLGFGLMALYNHLIIRYIVIGVVLLLMMVNIKRIVRIAKEYISLFK